MFFHPNRFTIIFFCGKDSLENICYKTLFYDCTVIQSNTVLTGFIVLSTQCRELAFAQTVNT